jgi:HTH-type transcriptional regulator, sugar sensing transcriptional regulator
MPPVIKNVLKQLGLAEKEIIVFSTLLKSGPMLVSQIAKNTKLNRTTTYGILHELSAKGLVTSVTKKGSATRYQSIAPEMLPGYLERRKEELESSKREIEKIIPDLLLLRKNSTRLPRVQYFEGARGVEQAYEDMLENNTERMIYALTGLEDAVMALDPKFQDYFITKRVRLGIKADYVVPDTHAARKETADDVQKMRVARFIPQEFNFGTEICVYDNRVSILSYALENPIALIIEDETIAHAMKQVFQFVWSKATPAAK